MSEQKGLSLFGNYFNLHPMDAYLHAEGLTSALEAFANSFKDRIEAEIDYSKAMLKIGKQLQRYISPEEPTPLSYISSAFKVEHQQRARHALELAEYLHTEIQVPCQTLLQELTNQLRRVEKELKKTYKQGEGVQEAYQKHLKKYFRSRQDWQEQVIAKNVLQYTPGATPAQKEKAITRVEQQRAENEQHLGKYLQALQVFNSFAQRFNRHILPHSAALESVELRGLAVQVDSIRKLIVSEVNMFKNIEYDLLNISRQMEAVSPPSQIESFVVSAKDTFKHPIISIYGEGPVVANRYQLIDFKFQLKRSLLEETLSRIDRGLFGWILENKSNSTLRYTVQRLLKRYEETEAGDNDFLEQFEGCIAANRIIREMPMDLQGPTRFLNAEEVYSLSLQVVTGIAQLMRPDELHQIKVKSLYSLIQGCLSAHHFYRFIAFLTLDQFQSLHEGKIESKLAGLHYLALIKLLLNASLNAKDIFTARCLLPLLFTVCTATDGRLRFLRKDESVKELEAWEDRDFWESAVFEGTFQLITTLPVVQRAELKEVYLMRQKNVVFSGLLDYCHYMVMLGVEVSETRSVMGRFAQIYELYEEHELDLAKTIANSHQLYRESLAD